MGASRALVPPRALTFSVLHGHGAWRAHSRGTAPVEEARRQMYGRRGHRRGSSVTRAPAWSAHRSSPLSLDAGTFTCLRTRPARGPHPPPLPSDTHGQKSTSIANPETGYNKAAGTCVGEPGTYFPPSLRSRHVPFPVFFVPAVSSPFQRHALYRLQATCCREKET